MSEEEGGTDLLYEFRNWVSDEEERQEYSRVFFADYYPHLPGDVQDWIRAKVLILYWCRIPVNIYNLPARWALLNPRQIRRYLDLRRTYAVRRLVARRKDLMDEWGR